MAKTLNIPSRTATVRGKHLISFAPVTYNVADQGVYFFTGLLPFNKYSFIFRDQSSLAAHTVETMPQYGNGEIYARSDAFTGTGFFFYGDTGVSEAHAAGYNTVPFFAGVTGMHFRVTIAGAAAVTLQVYGVAWN